MKYTIIALLFLGSCQSANPHIDLGYGARSFKDSQEWEDTNKHTGVMSAQVDFAGKDGIGFETGITLSEDTSRDPFYVNRSVNKTSTSVREFYLGVRKNHMVTEQWQVSIGGGMSAISIRTEVDLSYAGEPHDNDAAYVPYIHLGTRYFLTDHFTIGTSYRHHFLNERSNITITNPSLRGDMILFTVGWYF